MKINDKNLAAFATSPIQVDREGYLMKKGDGNKGFVKRWFVLKGNLFFYFDKKGDKEPLGVIILEGATVELADAEMDSVFCFKVTFPSKSYILGAESQTAMEQWMKSLACAGYDYVKLMANELQRQLDELCKDDVPIPTDGNSNLGSSSVDSVPTPPPKPRGLLNQQQKPQVIRRTFAAMHEQFGMKILRDQRSRWEMERDLGVGGVAGSIPMSSMQKSPPLLSSVPQPDLMHF